MSTTVISERGTIPARITNHRSFRQWIYSNEFPERGRFSFLDSEVWMDFSMETLAHNQIKIAIGAVLAILVAKQKLGRFLGDGMMLTHRKAALSTEPDGMFVSHQSIQSRSVRLLRGDESLEVIGTPDMVLEVVSKSSLRKDTVVLPELYFRAGIPEYWLVDSRPGKFDFEILRAGATKYLSNRNAGGWTKSETFGVSFKLTRHGNGGHGAEYQLETR